MLLRFFPLLYTFSLFCYGCVRTHIFLKGGSTVMGSPDTSLSLCLFLSLDVIAFLFSLVVSVLVISSISSSSFRPSFPLLFVVPLLMHKYMCVFHSSGSPVRSLLRERTCVRDFSSFPINILKDSEESKAPNRW